jgi:hypothetical protein
MIKKITLEKLRLIIVDLLFAWALLAVQFAIGKHCAFIIEWRPVADVVGVPRRGLIFLK